MELEKLFDKLWKTLYKPFIFYIPKQLFPDTDDEAYFNLIIFIDSEGYDSELKEQLTNYKILSKDMTLAENIFKLIDVRHRLSKTQFDFLLEKYMGHVNFLVLVSQWMQNNVCADVKILREETENAFYSQATMFLKHFDDIQSKVLQMEAPIVKEQIDVLKFIKSDLSDIKSALSLNKETEKIIKPLEVKNKPRVTRAKKKQPLITKEAAETFLLETVFNIKQV
ncbi:hypothetical protein [Lacinutrix undariae]